MNRGETKRHLRKATNERIRLERIARIKLKKTSRMEEKEARDFYNRAKIGTVFGIAEKMDRAYRRPAWAGQRWGAQ